MKYRLNIDIMFDAEDDAVDFLNAVEKVKQKAYKAKGDEVILTYRRSEYHKCFHDEIPPKPCKDYVGVDFDKLEETHEKKDI